MINLNINKNAKEYQEIKKTWDVNLFPELEKSGSEWQIAWCSFMKNVLIITYNFPPRPAVGGLRIYGLAKYLPQYGWNPIILTAILPGDPDPQFTVIQTPYNDVVAQWKKRLGLNPNQTLTEQFNVSTKSERLSIVERIALISSEIIAYPDSKRGWYDHAVLAGDKILKTQKIDAILSSSSPVTSHLIAKVLSEKYQIPWVADLRDLWTQNHYYQYSFIRNFFERKLELVTLSSTDALVTVSQPWCKELAKLHKMKKIHAIHNGYNPDEINPGHPLSKKFKILYAGSLYRGYQDPEPLFIVLNELIANNQINPELVSFDLFIINQEWLNEDVEKYNLKDIVHVHKPIIRNKILEKQRESQLLLILLWNNPNEKGVIPAKIFEYLAAKRPIISIGKYYSGELKEILEITNAGVELTEKGEIKKEIMNAYNEFIQNGSVPYHGIPTEIEKFSQIEMTRKFVEILNNIS